MKNYIILLLLGRLLVFSFIQNATAQTYLFSESDNSKGKAEGPFTGSSLSSNIEDGKVSFNMCSDSISFIHIRDKKPFYASAELSGKTKDRLISISDENKVSKKFNFGFGFGMRAFTKDDTLISNNKNLFKDTTTLVKSHMKWVAFNFNYEYEDFLRVYPDSVFYKQVEKYIFKNYYASFTVGSFSRRKSDKKIEKLIKKDGANPIILEKELYTFYTLNAYIGNSYNGDELTEVDVDDLIIQNNNLDTIRSYYRKQKAFFGNYKEQTLVNLRADFTFVPHKQYKKDTNPEPSGSKGCVECCKDPEPKYNIAGNIYIREEIRNGEFKYTAFGIGVNLVENINKLFEDRKAAGNKISFLAGISFEFKVNNNQKYSDPIQTTPTFRTGFSF